MTNGYDVTARLGRFRLIFQIYVILTFVMTMFYIGTLIVSVQSITEMVHTNQQNALLDDDLVLLDSYHVNGAGKWEVQPHDKDAKLANEYSNVELVYSLRINDLRDVSYFSRSENTIIQIVGVSFYIEYLSGSSFLIALLGFIVLIGFLIWVRKKEMFGWIAKPFVLIFGLVLGLLLFGTVALGFCIFAL